MKNFIKRILFAITLFTGGVMTSSCDPCSGIVCTDGTCSNGICICEPGYDKLNGECIPISSDYASEEWHGTQIHYSWAWGVDTQVVTYTIEPSAINPNQIVLKGFLGYIQNDLPFSIDISKRNIFVEELVLPVDITNGTLTNPSFLPVPYNVAGTILPDEMDITLTVSDLDSLENYYRLILQR